MKAIDNLTNLINLGHFGFVDIAKTSDGFYLGMEPGDIGFNAFIGKPHPVHAGPGLNRTLQVWNDFTDTEKTQVLGLAILKGIDLENEFGVPL